MSKPDYDVLFAEVKNAIESRKGVGTRFAVKGDESSSCMEGTVDEQAEQYDELESEETGDEAECKLQGNGGSRFGTDPPAREFSTDGGRQ